VTPLCKCQKLISDIYRGVSRFLSVGRIHYVGIALSKGEIEDIRAQLRGEFFYEFFERK